MRIVTMKKCMLALMLLAFMASSACAGVLDDLKTAWENSAPSYNQWTRTPQVIEFVKTVANNSSGRVRYETMGYTPIGTPMPLAIVGYPKAPKNPAEVGDRIVVFFLAGMHGAETAGVEGQLIFLREVAQGKHDELLKNVVLLIDPAYNADGVAARTRENSLGFDLNRDFSKMDTPETRALFKHMRKWDPAVLVDQHHIGLNYVRHPMTYTIGKSANNDPEIHRANQDFADSIFALGTTAHGIAAQATNFFRNYMKNFIDAATVYLSSAQPADVSRNSSISLSPMPYMGDLWLDMVDGVRKVVRLVHTNGDNVRTTFAYMTAKNRFAVLLEVPSQHQSLLLVNSQYASALSLIDQAGKQKDEILTFLKRKDAEMKSKTNTDGVNLFLGTLDTNLGATNAGNLVPAMQTSHDLGYGPGIFKLEGYVATGTGSGTGNNYNRASDDIHYPEVWNVNNPSNPTQMGAFYIIDSRADKIITGLLRHGIKVSKLTRDVPLPGAQTVKFFNPGQAQGNWTIARQTAYYEGHYATRVSGDWNPIPGGGDFLAQKGSYVVSSAQPYGRFASYWVEPKSVCGAFLWNFADDQLIRGGTSWTQASFDIVKTYSYSAIPDSALYPISFAEDENNEPEYTFAPPYFNLNGDFSGLTDAGATIASAIQNATNGEVKLSIQDACLFDGMWLTFFFYDEGGKRIDILKQVFESAAPGTYEAIFPYSELIKAGLVFENKYFIHYSNEWGDIFGYGTSSKGGLTFKKFVEPDPDPDPEPCNNGCNIDYAAITLLAFIPFFVIKRKR